MNWFGKKPAVDVQTTHEGFHGDHWGGIFGFDDQDYTASQVESIAHKLAYEKKIDRHTLIHKKKFGIASATGIQYEDELITMFPALLPSKSLPVTIKSVIEWMHSDGKEAQILAGGRDTFYLDFFATDYCENKKKYLSGGEVKVSLAGIAYVIDEHEPDNDPASPISPELCTYMPSPDRGQSSEFDFIGKVLSLGKIRFGAEEIQIIEVKLINDSENPDMFSLPLFVNPKNMRISNLSEGDMISGCFWLQGRIYW